ncbi:hypothetical protein FKM82_003646 [Ascaphus truei]
MPGSPELREKHCPVALRKMGVVSQLVNQPSPWPRSDVPGSLQPRLQPRRNVSQEMPAFTQTAMLTSAILSAP